MVLNTRLTVLHRFCTAVQTILQQFQVVCRRLYAAPGWLQALCCHYVSVISGFLTIIERFKRFSASSMSGRMIQFTFSNGLDSKLASPVHVCDIPDCMRMNIHHKKGKESRAIHSVGEFVFTPFEGRPFWSSIRNEAWGHRGKHRASRGRVLWKCDWFPWSPQWRLQTMTVQKCVAIAETMPRVANDSKSSHS